MKSTLTMGIVSFLLSFLGAWAYACFVSGWSLQAAQVAGIALSTTISKNLKASEYHLLQASPARSF